MARSHGFGGGIAKPQRHAKRWPTAATQLILFLVPSAMVNVVAQQAQQQWTSSGGGGPAAGLYGQISLPPDLLEALPTLTGKNAQQQKFVSHGQPAAEPLHLQLTEQAVKSNHVQELIGDLSAALVRSFTNLLLNSPASSIPSSASLSVPSSSSSVSNGVGSRTRKARQYDYYSAPPYQQQSPYYYGNTPQYAPLPPPSQYGGGGQLPWYYGSQQQQPYYGNQQQPPPYYGNGGGRLSSPSVFYDQQPYYYGASAPYIVPNQQQGGGAGSVSNPFSGYALQPQPQLYMPPAGQLSGPARHAQNQFGYGVNAGVYAGTFGGSSAISSPDGPYGAENSHVGSSYGGLSGWPFTGDNSTATAATGGGIIGSAFQKNNAVRQRSNNNSALTNNNSMPTTKSTTTTAPRGSPEANFDVDDNKNDEADEE